MSFFGRVREELEHLARHFSVEAFCGGTADAAMNAALDRSGRGHQRKSPLQPRLVMWLVLMLPVFRSESIPAVLARLLTGLRDLVPGLPLQPLEDDAIAHGRKRLGVYPLRLFFQHQAAEVRPTPSFHGFRVWSADGTKLTTPDTPANRRIFGAPGSSRGESAFPQIAMLGLQDVVTRRFRDVKWGRCSAAERPMLLPLLKHLGPGDLLLMDRGFYGAWFFEAIKDRGADFLCRAPATAKLKPIRGSRRKDGSYLAWVEARVPLPPGQTIKGPVGRPATTRKVRLMVRVIEYRVGRRERVRLVASLLDASIPARELALQYHERWQIELGFDEVKTHLSAAPGGACQTIFRGQSPRNVMQEAYALVASYNLIRETIGRAAQRRDIDPREISFVDSVRALTHMIPRMRGAAAERLSYLYDQLLGDIGETRMTRRCRPRSWPRVVRVKMSKFKAKRRHHCETELNLEGELRLRA